jgi:hypothetical protein
MNPRLSFYVMNDRYALVAAGFMSDDDNLLRAKARQAIERGELPGMDPVRWSGGWGTEQQCVVCGASIKRGDIELQLEFRLDGDGRHTSCCVHPRCFRIFILELGRLRADGQQAGKSLASNQVIGREGDT